MAATASEGSPPPPPPPQPPLLRELGAYLLRHHAHQQELPLDVGTFHRRVQRRCGKDPQNQQWHRQMYPTLCAAGAEVLPEAMQQLDDRGCVAVERLTAGPKTLTMLTWFGEAELRRYVLGAWGEGPAATIEQRKGQEEAVAAAATGARGSDATGQQAQERECSPQRKKVRVEEEGAAAACGEKEKKETVAEILGKPTALEALAAERFKKHAPVVREFCQHRTKVECEASSRVTAAADAVAAGHTRGRCTKLHFRRVIESHTDVSLGDCAYLSTCRRTRTCKYIHYEIEDETPAAGVPVAAATTVVPATAAPNAATAAAVTAQHVLQQSSSAEGPPPALVPKAPAQWVNTDVRDFDLSVLGQFAVIMADPPWEIHMDLPYGTMSDDEVCKLNFPRLQERDGGLLFLWVTGRAMERAREIFDFWGYRQVEEIVWVKTNQLQKVIRTGRTGHWLNHSKEHCLVGVKGQPRGLNRYLDCDVIVAEARETSRKPDEVYDIIERLSPGTRKLEIFGRRHNLRDGWVTVGNQLPPTYLVEPDVVARYQAWEAERRLRGGPRPREEEQQEQH